MYYYVFICVILVAKYTNLIILHCLFAYCVQVGTLKKGTVTLPVYRCARGTTSLESFHLHLARFIPGSSANAVNFQAYLLDGITRWNSDRATSALASVGESPASAVRSFDFQLQSRVTSLSESLGMPAVFPNYRPPARYTGELMGVEYLFAQTDSVLPSGIQLDKDIDEGLRDLDDQLSADTPPLPLLDEELLTVATPDETENLSEVQTSHTCHLLITNISIYVVVYTCYT